MGKQKNVAHRPTRSRSDRVARNSTHPKVCLRSGSPALSDWRNHTRGGNRDGFRFYSFPTVERTIETVGREKISRRHSQPSTGSRISPSSRRRLPSSCPFGGYWSPNFPTTPLHLLFINKGKTQRRQAATQEALFLGDHAREAGSLPFLPSLLRCPALELPLSACTPAQVPFLACSTITCHMEGMI